MEPIKYSKSQRFLRGISLGVWIVFVVAVILFIVHNLVAIARDANCLKEFLVISSTILALVFSGIYLALHPKYEPDINDPEF